jgi:hypothetical protein
MNSPPGFVPKIDGLESAEAIQVALIHYLV